LFAPDSDDWLALLRIGLGFQIVWYALTLRLDWTYILAGTGRGLISRDLAEAILSIESPIVPRLGWLVSAGSKLGIAEGPVLTIAWWSLVFAGILLAFGLFCRPMAIAGWLLHLAAVKSGDLLSYGVDNLTTIGLFYLMLSPLPDRYSLDWHFRKPQPKDPQLLGFWRRVLQLHLCVIYFFGGFTKCLGSGWWNGSNLWRALIRPPFNVVPPEILVKWKYAFPIAGIAVWLIELGFPFFIWSRRTRAIWLLCVILMHVGIGLFMGMYLFASIMIILNLAAFGPGFVFKGKIFSRIASLYTLRS
jgi:Vitamin K-dependent gamma-carboxylase